MKQVTTAIALLSFGCFLWAGTATAITTGIGMAEPGGILDQMYGLSNLVRVDDDVDQIWFPANGNATVVAKFPSSDQDFGYIPDLNSDNIFDEAFVSLLTVPGGTTGINLGGPSGALTSGNVNFVWALNPSGEPLWTSRTSQNSDSLDHMVTWAITGGAGAGNWVIAWEETNGGGDRNFADLVLEVSVYPIPEPATSILLGSALIGLGVFGKKPKK
jgi:hypothetical protein